MHETARRAVATDVDTLAALADEGRAGVADARGGAMWLRREALPGPTADLFDRFIDAPDHLPVVATIDDVPLGYMLVHAVGTGDAVTADIAELYVTPDARGVGLGEAMMNLVVDWSAARGMAGLTGRALPGDRATKNFFETFGLVARSIEVYRALEPGA